MAAHETLAEALRRASVKEIALRARVPRRSVQGLLDGHIPSIDRAEKIAAALGLEFYVGPPRDAAKPGSDVPDKQPADAQSTFAPGNVVAGTQVLKPLTTFSWHMTLPVRGWKHCSPDGYLAEPEQVAQAPAPVDLIDDEAFYAQMRGQSLMREGIGGLGFYGLVSPNTPLDADELVWLRNRHGQEVIRRLVLADGEAFLLHGWGPADGNGHQDRIAERWMRDDVEASGVVLAVYAGWPSVKNPPFRVPDVAGSESERVVRLPVPDPQLEALLVALVKHYGQLNEYGRRHLVAGLREHVPADAETEGP